MLKSHKQLRLYGLLLLVLLVNSCSQASSSPVTITGNLDSTQPAIVLTVPYTVPTQPSTQLIETHTGTPAPIPSQTSLPATLPPEASQTPTADTRLSPYYWRNWPVIPVLSARAISVYKRGQELGNNLHSFSRIGDCQSVPAIFMGIYDSDRYWLGTDSEYLQSTIDQFAGSFERTNVTVKDGFGVASVLTPLMSDPELCQSGETPLDCEYRLHKPIIAFIAMGTNWKPSAEITFDRYLRQIVDFSIEHGIIPILVTKADNIEADNLLNRTIAQVAYDYDMPLFNAWAAVQNLPNHGLEEDKIYLTTEAWDTRSFTALQVLDSIWTTLRPLSPYLTP